MYNKRGFVKIIQLQLSYICVKKQNTYICERKQQRNKILKNKLKIYVTYKNI